MGFRITTWNVNGIRNPFGYQPWRDKRTFQAMFDILGADIVVFQETKIQRKDLSDDMVLVPGWDCYFSLPKYKKGYSGVVIYTRQSVCSPIRAEEGISGVLCPSNSSISYRDLPATEQIGGYPNEAQLSQSAVDAATIDSEGRCVILEFPAFVLLGVYSPANRDESRDDFRLGFLDLLDARIRNLISMGKRVFLTGDLNISREEIDAANAEASMRKQGLTNLEFVSTPARRLFNQLLEGGKVHGEKDPGREQPVLWDICRAFHPRRAGMFTCWEQKVNARPANCGARIDYVLSSRDMKEWFSDSNIQEGLMGSDHCPVYADFKDKVVVEGQEQHLLDLMNLPGTFSDGQRKRQYSMTTDPRPNSGRLIPEFSGRRNIRDMFSRKPSQPDTKSLPSENIPLDSIAHSNILKSNTPSTSPGTEHSVMPQTSPNSPATGASPTRKRSLPSASNAASLKRVKSMASNQGSTGPSKGQKSLKGFFKPKSSAAETSEHGLETPFVQQSAGLDGTSDTIAEKIGRPDEVVVEVTRATPSSVATSFEFGSQATSNAPTESAESSGGTKDEIRNDDKVHDPIESKESWSKLFTKPTAPRCESHDEPCVSLLTKKPGMNLGRSFWMCPRPLGPSGAKETNTQWRCHTFIWCSDWNSCNKIST